MARIKPYHHLLNVGVVDEKFEHRVDLEVMRLAARQQTNIIGLTPGPGMVRPGFKYLSANRSNAQARLLPFIAGPNDAFLLELTDGKLRVRDCDTDELVTRVSVSTAFTSGDFSASTGWTLSSASGSTASISGGFLLLSARGKGAEAFAKQTLTIAGGDQNKVHALEINVPRGPVRIRVGSADGKQDYLSEQILRTGYHSLAFTPTSGSAFVKIYSALPQQKIVDSIAIASAGVMELTTPWAIADVGKIRYDQSLDVMFLACKGYAPQRIERRSDVSWSVVNYTSDDGPFTGARTAEAKLTPSVLEGNGTLTSDVDFFTSSHVGALFYLYHEGQRIDTYLAGGGQFTDVIEVTGVNETSYNDRDFTYSTTGTWVGTLKVQRSFDSDVAGFQEFRNAQASSTIGWTSNVGPVIDDDNEDNAIAWYRIGFEASAYTSGEARVTIQYGGGGGFGICRVTGFTDAKNVSIEVLTPFKGLDATSDWREGEWSAARGYPTAVRLSDGRLIWVGEDKVWGSVSDAYDSFDETVDGDSGPILRSIAIGGRNEPAWMANLSSLVVGTNARVVAVQANSLEDIITPSNFKLKSLGKQPAAQVDMAELAENRLLFVHGAGNLLMEISYDASQGGLKIAPFSQLQKDLLGVGIVEMAVQTSPEQRVWAVLADGSAMCITFDADQKVVCYTPIATATGSDATYVDAIESVCVIPGEDQDRVYFSIKRRVNGATVRYTEKMAYDVDAAPLDVCKVMDSFVTGGASTTTISLAHLKGREVYAWVDGAPVETSRGVPQAFTVDGTTGNITLPVAPATGYCVGLAYPWVYETARLEYGLQGQSPLLATKAISNLGLMLMDYCRQGVLIGTRDADKGASPTDPLPRLQRGKQVADVVVGNGGEGVVPVPGSATIDTRLIVRGSSPYPCTIGGFVFTAEIL